MVIMINTCSLRCGFFQPISTINLLIRARPDMGNLSVTFNSTGTKTNTEVYTYYKSGATNLCNTFIYEIEPM